MARYLSQKKQRKSIGSVHILNQFDGDYRRISLLLSPPKSSSHQTETGAPKIQKQDAGKMEEKKRTHLRYQVRIILGTIYNSQSSDEMNIGWIPRARLFPNRVNNKFSPELKRTSVGSSDASPTPTYTSSLVEDWNHVRITEILAQTAQSAGRSFTESWTLIKIWCLQRGFLRGEDTLTENHIGLTLAYLYRTKLVSHRMDCIQIFTIWMKFMADTNWLGEEYYTSKLTNPVGRDTIRFSDTEGYRNTFSSEYHRNKVAFVMPVNMQISEKQTIIDCIQNRIYLTDCKETKARVTKSLGQAFGEKVPSTLLDCYKVFFDGPVFLDSTMTLNYFSRLSSSFIRILQMEARKSLHCIHTQSLSNQTKSTNSTGFDPFRHLFLEHLRFWRSHDMYVKVKFDDIKVPTNNKQAIWGTDAYDVGAYESIKRGLIKTLRLALSDRVYCVRVLTTGNGEINEKTIAQQRDNFVGDFGLNILVGTDEIQAIPIRYSNENMQSFYGYDFGDIVSPVSRGRCLNDYIVLGINVNSGTCPRIIDRGPPAEDNSATASFVQLWGEEKAQLRRFKDGAIVHAALWNQIDDAERSTTHFEGDGKTGAIVERIVRHIIRTHFTLNVDTERTEFALRDMQSLICGAVSGDKSNEKRIFHDPIVIFKEITTSFDMLSSFLIENSKSPSGSLGIPLTIESVEPLSASLRYSDLFPPLPHPTLGARHVGVKRIKISGASVGDSILIQLRLEKSSNWPNQNIALEAAKCAMLLQLAKGLEKMKEEKQKDSQFLDGPIHVYEDHLDIGFRGLVWKIILRVEHEMRVLETASVSTIHRYQVREHRF